MAFVVSTAIGFSLYFVFPVIGPLNLYGAAFPDNLPVPGSIAAADLMIATRAPRNGMPSLHTAWALLIWFNARPLAAMPRQLFRAFAVLNLLATIGLLDAHWLTDLVVGAPLAISVQALCSVALPFQSRVRWTAVVTGFALIGAWFAALWWGLGIFEAVPGLSWFAVAITLAVVAALGTSICCARCRWLAPRFPSAAAAALAPDLSGGSCRPVQHRICSGDDVRVDALEVAQDVEMQRARFDALRRALPATCEMALRRCALRFAEHLLLAPGAAGRLRRRRHEDAECELAGFVEHAPCID